MTRKSLKNLKQWAHAIKKDLDIIEASGDWDRNTLVQEAKTYLEERFKVELMVGTSNKIFFRERKLNSRWKVVSQTVDAGLD